MSEIVFNSPTAEVSLKSQVESLQTTLASLNQQVISLQEALQERDQEIAQLKMRLAEYEVASQTFSGNLASKVSPFEARDKKVDDTLTIIGALIHLYKFIFPPRKDVAVSTDT